jgi:2'-5' RNA ligase
MQRLFVAIELNDETKEGLHALQQAFEPRLSSGMRIRWTDPDNLHLTLKFLGATEDDLVDEVTDVVERAARQTDPFELTARGIGAFPRPNYPRILWAGVDEEASGTLGPIHQFLEDSLFEPPFDVDRDEHAFSAHITVGRVKSSRAPKLTKIRNELPQGPYGTTDVRALTLYESNLDQSGPDYRIIHRASLV